jgi:hypothetical protein
MKSYTYLDQAPLLEVDIHEGLENTLVIMQHKLKQGVSIKREYSPNLPRIAEVIVPRTSVSVDTPSPLTVQVTGPSGVEAGMAEWPDAEESRGAGQDGVASMQGGTIRGLVPLTFPAAPGAGDLVVTATLSYQLRDNAGRLLPPSSVEVRVGVTELAMVDRTLPVREGV